MSSYYRYKKNGTVFTNKPLQRMSDPVIPYKRKAKRSSSYGNLLNKMSISSMVKKEIKRTAEHKRWEFAVANTNLTFYNNQVNATFQAANVIGLGPNATNTLVQGTGMSDRIGDKITITKVTMNVIIIPDYQGANSNDSPIPIDIRMIACHSKPTPQLVTVSSTFFQTVDTTAAPASNIVDMLAEVNKDIYVVKADWRCKVAPAAFTGTGDVPGLQYYANNDYKFNYVKKLDVTKWFPKHIQWSDTTTLPTSMQPFLVVLIARADGSTPAGGALNTNEYPLNINYEVIIEYIDN